jgi:hypothetical protein
MNDEDVCERLERAAHGMTRRAAMATALGGALLLGVPEASEANQKAKRRKKQRRKRWPKDRMIEILLDNGPGTAPVPVTIGYWYGEWDCCRQLTAPTIPSGSAMTFQVPRSGHHQDQNNGWAWIGEKYWFRFYNPGVGEPGIGIAIDGMLDHPKTPPCCATLPWGRTVEYQRGFSPGQTRTYNIENRALFSVQRLSDSKDYKRFRVTLPPAIPPAPGAPG